MKKQKENKQPRREGFVKQLQNEFKRHKATFIIYMVLRTLVILGGVRLFFLEKYESVFLCGCTLLLFLVPAFVQKTFRVELPSLLEVIVLFFIFAEEILGEIGDYYVKFAFWDTMLHITTGFLAAAVGLSLINILNNSERVKLKLSPLFVALVSFCFSMTIGVLWEFFEFSADVLLHTDMQKDTVIYSISSVLLNPEPVNSPVIIDSITETVVNGERLNVDGYLDIGLYDTMKDMFVNFIGAVVFSIFGYFYAKHPGKGTGSRIVEGLQMRRRSNHDEHEKER